MFSCLKKCSIDRLTYQMNGHQSAVIASVESSRVGTEHNWIEKVDFLFTLSQLRT